MTGHEILPTDDPVPFFPTHFRKEAAVALGMITVAAIVGVVPFFRMELGEPADPLNTPAGVKPEWYFLAIYQVIKFIPKLAGVLLPLAAVAILFLWPFIDRRPDMSRRATRVRAVVAAIALTGFVALTIWGGM